MGVVLYGGAFDPPHLGHVAVADAARERFGVERLVVLVSERPAHREVHASAEDRLALARAAFPGDDVRLDPYPRTVELLRAERFDDPVFVDRRRPVPRLSRLERARRGARARRGSRSPRGPASREPSSTPCSRSSTGPSASLFFEIEPNPAASTDVRARVAAGEPLDGLVPAAVAQLIEERGLYRP